MRRFVHLQTRILLRKLALQINRAAREGNPEAVHDLRVSIRRFSRCLRVFAQFYPGNSGKRMRRHLTLLMDDCAAVRDLDIAIDLLGKAGLPQSSPVVRRLEGDRADAARRLSSALRHWKSAAIPRKWKTQLGL